MAGNQRYTHGKHIALTATKVIKSGDPVLIGGFAGVALINAAIGQKVTVWLDGSYDLTVTGAATEGAVVYITSAGALTMTAAGNTPFGLAINSKGTGSGVLEVAPLGKTVPTTGA